MSTPMRREASVLSALAEGKTLERRRGWHGRFIHAIDNLVVEDRLVRQLLATGRIRLADRTPDGEYATYALTSAAATSEPASAAAARRTDRPTSREAAQAVGDIRPSQREVLRLFWLYGAGTHADIIRAAAHEAQRMERTPYSDSRYRSACAELARAGLLRPVGTQPTGHTSKTGHITYATSWDLTDRGARLVGGPAATVDRTTYPAPRAGRPDVHD